MPISPVSQTVNVPESNGFTNAGGWEAAVEVVSWFDAAPVLGSAPAAPWGFCALFAVKLWVLLSLLFEEIG